MKKQEGFLDSSDGKNKLHVTRWLPDQESPNVWVQLVHGMNEHMGRYEEFAAYLAEHGIAVMERRQLLWRIGVGLERGRDISFWYRISGKWRFMEKEYFRKRNM